MSGSVRHAQGPSAKFSVSPLRDSNFASLEGRGRSGPLKARLESPLGRRSHSARASSRRSTLSPDRPPRVGMGALSRCRERAMGVSEGSRASERTSGDDGAHPGHRRAASHNRPRTAGKYLAGADDVCTTSPLIVDIRVEPPLHVQFAVSDGVLFRATFARNNFTTPASPGTLMRPQQSAAPTIMTYDERSWLPSVASTL